MNLLSVIIYNIGSRLGKYPSLFFFWRRVFRPNTVDYLVNEETDLVIEGFPRSGNTFAVAAFLLSQASEVKLAHHTHKPANVIQAIRLTIPAIVIIRNPLDAIVSLTIRHPEINPRLGLRSYIRFYRQLYPYRKGFLIAQFEEVINDFGQIIRRVNTRFDTSFDIFHHTEENVQACFKMIEEMDKSDTGREHITASKVARPSDERENKKKTTKQVINRNAVMRKLLQEAGEIYQDWTGEHNGAR